MTNDEPIEHELIRNGTSVHLHAGEPVVTPCPAPDDSYIGDMVHVRIEGRIGDPEEDEDEDEQGDLTYGAFGLIFTFGALSFADARPRGGSIKDYRAEDAWTASDMLRHLCFDQGALAFYADYVRGRMMKTRLIVRKDGTFVLETQNRGEAASRWIAHMQGKEAAPASVDPSTHDLN
jgi:hypothetical protein